MSDLIGKLNVLVKSNLRHVLPLERRKDSGSASGGRDLQRDIAALRQRINQALDDEDKLKRDILALRHEAVEWDRKADAALSNGDEANARYAVQQMQTKQQQATLLEADLEQHRYSAAELIRQVNELEAIAAEAAAAQADSGSTSSSSLEPPSQSLHATPPGSSSTADDDLESRRARLSQ